MKRIVVFIFIFLTIQLQAYSFGKNKVQVDKTDWSKIETMHFDIYFPRNENKFGKIAALMAEEAYYHIKADFNSPVKGRIPIIFYKSHQDFETTNVIYSILGEGVGGFTESAKNRVAVPFDGSYKALEEVLTHELTHAYINDMNRNRNRFMNLSGLPFWLQEGLPEFESVHGEDVYNNMFVIDLLINEKVPNLDQIGGYYAYRLGESFLTFIDAEYGRDTVIELFFALRYNSTAELAFKKVFDMEFEEVQKRWKNYLKRNYFPDFDKYDIPYEVFEKKTDHQKDGSSMNYAPSFSPDGNSYLYFSNKNIRNEIWYGSTLDLKKNKRIMKGESSGKFEEFHFRKNNISWFPDSNRFAFVSKTSYGDRIYVMDQETYKLVYTIAIPGFDAIFEIDVSPDGQQIVFSGLKNEQSNIYIYNIVSEEVEQITDSDYYDSQPRWSNDGTKIVFTSERTIYEEGIHVFDALSSDIFYYDLNDSSFYQVTRDSTNNYSPFFNRSDDLILFIAEDVISSNFNAIDLRNGSRAAVTNVLGGVFTGDLSADDSEMIFSCFFEGGWDVYLKSNPLHDLEFEEYGLPTKCDFINDLFEKFSIERYEVFGKRERKFQKEMPEYPKYVTRITLKDFAEVDSMRQEHNRKIDAKPSEILMPEISDYKPKFGLDYVWGGAAYSPSGGTYAQFQFGLSDLMGNHSFGFNLGISGDMENSDFIMNYIYLANRIDFGFGGFYLSDEWVYQLLNSNGTTDYFRERQKEFGIYSVVRYPFNKFWRIDLENLFYRIDTKRDWWDGNSWMEEYLDPGFVNWYEERYNESIETSETEDSYAPQITLVHDNAIYGNVGPVMGWRVALTANRNFSTKDSYSVLYGDLRSYTFFAKRYSFAFRAAGGAIIGDTNQRFEMDYYDGVRGLDYNDDDADILGKRELITSMELRFPFIDNMKMSFPMPLFFYQVRGSAFLDLGATWMEDEDLQLVENGVFKDLLAGVGFGPRLNMGYFVLKFDVAWNTDLSNFSKPSYYITLTPDF